MSNLKLLFNNLKRNKFYKCFIVLIILSVVIYNLFIIFSSAESIKSGYADSQMFLYSSCRFLNYLSIIFIFFSYECFFKINSYKESINVCKKSIVSVYKTQICLFLLFIMLLTVIEVIFNLIDLAICKQIDIVILIHTVSRLVCYFILVLTASVFIGLLLSFIKKRFFAYILMLLFAVSEIELMEDASVNIFNNTGKDLSKLFELFKLIPHSINWTPNYLSGLIFDFNKISLILFYIVLSALIVILINSKSKKEKVWKSTVCTALCVCLLFGYLMPVSNPKYDTSASGLSYDAYYYIFYKDYVQEKPADFNVEKYDLKFSAFLNLKADAKIYVDKNNLDEYKFTLYHKYKVKSITNQNGEKLDFKQESDYLTVKANGETEYLNIKYYGGSSQYYSSYSGINLPGNFYFYPVAGFHKMFKNYYGFVCRALPNETVFNVEFDYTKTIYSNLEETEENKFSGTADSLTFMSGYYKTEKIEDTVVYYPYMSKEYKVDDLHKYLDTFIKENSSIKKIFFVPKVYSSQYAGTRMYDDYVFLNEKFDVDQKTFESKIDYTKQDLFFLTKLYYNPDTNAEELKQIEETANDEEKYQISVLKSLFASENREEAEEEIVDYLTDEKDLRAPSEFLTELGEKYA